ncbi:hypothetical protein DRO21_06185 [archaeon]|nr:MAG: hypothetical protein DRO21_06185 [archaeon]
MFFSGIIMLVPRSWKRTAIVLTKLLRLLGLDAWEYGDSVHAQSKYLRIDVIFYQRKLKVMKILVFYEKELLPFRVDLSKLYKQYSPTILGLTVEATTLGYTIKALCEVQSLFGFKINSQEILKLILQLI